MPPLLKHRPQRARRVTADGDASLHEICGGIAVLRDVDARAIVEVRDGLAVVRLAARVGAALGVMESDLDARGRPAQGGDVDELAHEPTIGVVFEAPGLR